MSVRLLSKLTISADFELTNNSSPTTVNARPGVSDDDVVQFNGVDLADDGGNTDVSTSKLVTGTTPVNPGQTVIVSAPNLISNKTMFDRTIDNSDPTLNDFIGAGPLDITYTNTSGFSIIGAVQVNPTFVVNTTFTLTYSYCYTGTLAADILSFNAFKQDKQTIALNWLTTNETPGRKYTVEVSNGNGNNFTAVATIPADVSGTGASYAYAYAIKPGDNGKLYFRLKLTGADGSTAYSILRVVDLGGVDAGKFSLYPNPPSDFINLTFPGDNQDWQVDILTADGSQVQLNYYRNSNAVRVNFTRRLAAGAYFVRATSPQTGKYYTGSFIVR